MTAWRLDEAECAELVELLVGLVASPSPDPPGNEAAVAGFLIGWLEERGFDVTRDEFAPDRINVLARLKGDGSKPALIFSAHMDTLPIGDGDWGHPAFGAEIEDGKLYGRGATDMKSGLAAMAAAALKLRRADVALAGDLILAFSAGESSNLLGAERMVEAGNLKGAGALLVSEPTSLGLVTAEAGALWLRVVASGRPGHASAGTADNAILKLMDFLADVRTNPFADKTNPLLGTATLAINTISGGTAVNLTADRAEATLDIRTIPGLTTADVLARLRAIAGEAIVIDVMDEKPPVVTDPTDPFAETCLDAVQAVRGVRPKPGGVSYFSDSAAFVPALNIPRVIIGPGQIGTSGQRDEWVALDDFATAAEIFAEIAVRMLGAD
ncbi:MAG: M20 family metallopeptidase [Rhodospirillaceae bacterium]|nr:M20 family metallopeptidase [Rhodospirillaceae bacterium]